MTDINLELATLIVRAVDLHEVDPREIDADQPLFIDGLGLDSMDSIEVIVALEARYGVSISDNDTAKAALASLNALADFISKNRTR